MLTVTILGLDDDGGQVERGRLTWDGTRVRAHFPPAEQTLAHSVLTAAVVDADGKEHTAADGEPWLRALCLHYRSPYCLATEADDTEAEE